MILSRVKISPQQRYDLEDFFAQLAAARTDSKLWTKQFLSDQNLILGGFTVSGVGLNSATVNMANATLIIPQNTFDFSYFISEPGAPNVTIPDADLADGTRNYVEIALSTQDNTPLTKAFWDPEANSGNGAEFNQIVNTVTDLKVSFVVSTGGFSGLVDRLPLCIIDTDGSGVIKVILDRRELYGRLAKPNDLDNQYSWGTKIDPTYALNMSGVVGVFVAGEIITIGGETATVITGGTTNIAFNEPTGINFGNGDSVVGGTSGATGTVNTITESFVGVDKSLNNQKEINDALMTEFKGVKGTRFWWQTGPSLVGIKREGMSTVAPISTGAKVKWTGSAVIITDDSLTPALTDNIASVRLLSSTANLMLRRQDDGKEVVTISLSDVPDTGILTLDQDGNSIPIDWNDSTSDIQATWNGSGAYAATISGSPASKKIIITANAAGLQVDVTTDTNTFENSGDPVTETITIKQGMAADGSIALADGQVLYVDIPAPLVSTNYSGVGVGAANYKVTNRGNPLLVDSTYWLAYREGSKLIWRFAGELESGESTQIGDNVPQSLLDAIGLATEASLPSYSSNIRGSAQESIVSRASILTDALGDAQEDRSAYLYSDDVVSWDGEELAFTTDIILAIVNTKTGVATEHTVEVANSPIALNDGESVWVLVDRDLTSQVLTLNFSDSLAIPAQTQANKDVFVLFRRRDAGAIGFLHIPLHKQMMEEGQAYRIGASPTSNSQAALNRWNAAYDAVVGSAPQVSSGAATHTSIMAALGDVPSGGRILILRGTYTENVVISGEVDIDGVGHSTVINGTLDFDASALYSYVRNLKVTDDITFDTDAKGCWMIDGWIASGKVVSDAGVDNTYDLVEES